MTQIVQAWNCILKNVHNNKYKNWNHSCVCGASVCGVNLVRTSKICAHFYNAHLLFAPNLFRSPSASRLCAKLCIIQGGISAIILAVVAVPLSLSLSQTKSDQQLCHLNFHQKASLTLFILWKPPFACCKKYGERRASMEPSMGAKQRKNNRKV